ncbi:MAG: HAD-IIB family hydrolase [Candidatus Zixiibacteriota bacterium]|nr:MAG: HAD-IIB family hydrolase [candidate division Zixibacteria bacterium]
MSKRTSLKLVIFSDLDGTLLDRITYAAGPAVAALESCRSDSVPVVLVSAKTRAEMEPIRSELQLDAPFIVENGGGIYLPKGYFAAVQSARKVGGYECVCRDISIENLRGTLKQAARETGVETQGFGDMSESEIASLTGLSITQSALAKQREFDEPFIVKEATDEKIGRLKCEIELRGCRYNFGGSFHHITGDFDKGDCVRQVMSLFRTLDSAVEFAAVGDAYNDLPMLRAVDHPFLVRSVDGSFDAGLVFDHLTVLDSIGPEGFAQAVKILLQK